MYKLTIYPRRGFNQTTWEFYEVGPKKPVTHRLEHSLISITKWESRTRRRFLFKKEMPSSNKDWLVYISCMSLDGDLKDDEIAGITKQQIKDVVKYITTSQSATTFKKKKRHGQSQVLSSELIYYYMGQFNLPWHAEKWHLSRLLSLIEIANEKGQPAQKMSDRNVLKQNAELNRMRRNAMHTKG